MTILARANFSSPVKTRAFGSRATILARPIEEGVLVAQRPRRAERLQLRAGPKVPAPPPANTKAIPALPCERARRVRGCFLRGSTAPRSMPFDVQAGAGDPGPLQRGGRPARPRSQRSPGRRRANGAGPSSVPAVPVQAGSDPAREVARKSSDPACQGARALSSHSLFAGPLVRRRVRRVGDCRSRPL